MNKNYNDCDIVFDLLPLYLDGKTGKESNELVGKHLEECSECREVHRLMSAENFTNKDGLTPEAKAKSRKRGRGMWKRVAILIVGLVGYICLMIGIVMYAYWILVADVL